MLLEVNKLFQINNGIIKSHTKHERHAKRLITSLWWLLCTEPNK